MKTVVLDRKKHLRKEFDCGVGALNNYLCVMANQQTLRDNSRTYILEDNEKPGRIIAYYTLAMTHFDLT